MWTEWECNSCITEGRGIDLIKVDVSIAMAPDGYVVAFDEVARPKEWRGPLNNKTCRAWLLKERVWRDGGLYCIIISVHIKLYLMTDW